MAVVALVMLAEYSRVVLTIDGSSRKVFVLIAWAVMLITWLWAAIYRTWFRNTED